MGVPVVDLSQANSRVAETIARACRDHGFFYVAGHGVGLELQSRLDLLAREFFRLPEEEKKQIEMAKGGRAWRGYFPVGGELTSGTPDLKEGLYFAEELAKDHPAVKAGLALHGPNLFPARPSALRETVLEYMSEMTRLGHRLMAAIALSLELPSDFFEKNYTGDPFYLFRIFNYPAPKDGNQSALWGVGEHTDYGFLTILKQDDCGGLEVKSQGGWISAPPIENTFVCNIGDMLDRMTCGLYRSTPHRVKNVAGSDRVSFPFFFDPAFSAHVSELPLSAKLSSEAKWDGARWDGADLSQLSGTYGDYLLGKVSKVFPALGRKVL